jgi:hypothetical protein
MRRRIARASCHRASGGCTSVMMTPERTSRMATSTCAWLDWKRLIVAGRIAAAIDGNAATVIRPLRTSTNCVSSPKAPSNSARMRLATGTRFCPAGESSTFRVSRSKSRTPTASLDLVNGATERRLRYVENPPRVREAPQLGDAEEELKLVQGQLYSHKL